MIEQFVKTTIDHRGVATVTLNNPDKHNAFDDAIIAGLSEQFQQLANNDAVRIVVLASEGRSFSAGADLGWMKRVANYSKQDNYKDARVLAKMLHQLNFIPKPTIARIQGPAFGGAVGLVSCCDIAIASPRASFSLSEVKIGLIPATISPYVINAIGSRAARRYFTTAERFSADEAERIGLVHQVVEEDQLDNAVETIIEALLGNSPAAIEAAKQLIFDVEGKPITDALMEDTSERIAAIRVSPEGQEGLTAFLEKRPAAWINQE